MTRTDILVKNQLDRRLFWLPTGSYRIGQLTKYELRTIWYFEFSTSCSDRKLFRT